MAACARLLDAARRVDEDLALAAGSLSEGPVARRGVQVADVALLALTSPSARFGVQLVVLPPVAGPDGTDLETLSRPVVEVRQEAVTSAGAVRQEQVSFFFARASGEMLVAAAVVVAVLAQLSQFVAFALGDAVRVVRDELALGARTFAQFVVTAAVFGPEYLVGAWTGLHLVAHAPQALGTVNILLTSGELY
jgi:hypothetical protein